MKIQFKHQKFQADAAAAVCDIFKGFTGAFTGMFCIDTANYAVYTDFRCFMYMPLPE
ncbi:hypothetical protein AGMMS49942_09380 [Spirochaetia bacterium]|nr:hypothetical protein AGMMS49942_09380 [Spirochaetia bacterium]